jgi:hypothetical protein
MIATGLSEAAAINTRARNRFIHPPESGQNPVFQGFSTSYSLKEKRMLVYDSLRFQREIHQTWRNLLHRQN